MWIGLFHVLSAVTPVSEMKEMKNIILRRYLLRVEKGVQVSPGFFAFNGEKIEILGASSLGYWFRIFDFDHVKIGKALLASHNVTLIAGTHEADIDRTYRPGPISIGDNVWIGAGVTIVGPCVIGDGCVIGAHSFVSGEFGSNLLIAGSPAKIKKAYNLVAAK